MHTGDLGRHERKTAPLLRNRLFFRSPRYYEAGSVLPYALPPNSRRFERDSFARVRSSNEQPLFFLFSLFFPFSHASTPFHFSSEYMVGHIQIEIFGRLIPEKRRPPLPLRGASIVIFENSSSLSLRTFGRVTVSFDNRDVTEREKGGLEGSHRTYNSLVFSNMILFRDIDVT